jgi:signal transduction histidine kinase/ActR/RegA family two-component response regulator
MPAAIQVSNDPGQLRRCIRDLLALGALPAIWRHQDARQIAESLADSLVGVLGLEFVYIQLSVAMREPDREILRTASGRHPLHIADVKTVLADWLRPHLPHDSVQIANPMGPGVLRALFVPVGLSANQTLVAASRNPDFPDEIDRLLFSVAASQAALALERQHAEQALFESEGRLRRLSDELEQRVAERTRQLEVETAEREQAEAAFRQAQRMEAMGQLTGGVAHDFNNLLLVMGGNLELLQGKLSEPEAALRLGAIERAIRRGESLTRQLLAFSRNQALRPMILDLRQRLPKVMELIRPSLRGDIEFRVEIDPTTFSVEVDPGELELAVLNIAVNARDAMPKGGQLVLRARNRSPGQGGLGGNLSVGEFAEISISDTGEGIPADVLPRVFEPFFTTKEVGRGSGLGLSQVYGFARQSGGTALIDSNPGVGTVVTLLLPRSATAAPMEARVIENQTGQLSARVLLVEDNDDVAEIALLMLEELGCRVQRAQTARQALDTFERDAIDLVMSDIVMPGGMNGLDLARNLRDHSPGLPILLTTGYSSAAQDAAKEQLAILAKPYRRDQLAAAILAALKIPSRHES